MVPKIFHFILGLVSPPGQQVSPVYDFDFMCYLSIKSKLVAYPDYRIWLWNNPDCDLSENEYFKRLLDEDVSNKIELKSLRIFREPTEREMDLWWITRARFSLAYLADYYRFHILNTVGGIYCDTDCITVNPFPFDTVEESVISIEADNKSNYPLLHKLAGIHFFCSKVHGTFVDSFLDQRIREENRELNNVELAYKVASSIDNRYLNILCPSEYFIPVPIGLQYQQLLFETTEIDWHPFNYELHLYNSACSRNGFKDKYLNEKAIKEVDSSFTRIARRYLD